MTNVVSDSSEVYIGVDIGTQGVRVMAIDDRGDLVAQDHLPLTVDQSPPRQHDPEDWWSAVLLLLGSVDASLKRSARSLRPVSISVAGTSGTIIPLDDHYRPICGALMYSDTRAFTENERVRDLAPELGCSISWAIPKMMWLQNHHPHLVEHIRAWCHVTDFIIGRLTGQWQMTDETSALKSGYDPVAKAWSSVLWERLGIVRDALPNVVPSGSPIGPVLPSICEETGLPADVIVTTGMTDGCASQVASGAVSLGSWNTTIGTTMVIKGVTQERIANPTAAMYHHRHPDGYWMPGGASNTGAEWISKDYDNCDLESLNRMAQQRTPTRELSYPLCAEGERFPFVAREARGFDPSQLDDVTRFTARMEGVAYLERLAYAILERFSKEPATCVYSAGGGSKSDVWLGIRSGVLQRTVIRSRYPDGAVGAAVVGASRTAFSSLGEAAQRLIKAGRIVEPQRDGSAAIYDDTYHRFCEELHRRGYLDRSEFT